jgi:hypothetical protein
MERVFDALMGGGFATPRTSKKLDKFFKRNPFDKLIFEGMFNLPRTGRGTLKPHRRRKPRGGGGGRGF